MKKIILMSLFLLSTVVLAACVPGVNNGVASQLTTEEPPGDLANFAQCLSEQGAAMYGADWCPHCNAQKEMFGDDWQYINYIECERNKATCTAAGISGYPTWVINGQHYPGEATFEKLSRLSGCELTQTPTA